jgi:hypothetical protein
MWRCVVLVRTDVSEERLHLVSQNRVSRVQSTSYC